jgi:D-alanyl-lipoteichoic acid acyltransferase DltB (MBOAT superfamily)
MLFYKPEYFLLFLPVVLILFFRSKFLGVNFKYILIISSLIFYSYWNLNYLPLIVIIIISNYFLALLIIKKKKYLAISIVYNLLILILFKYLDFLIINLNFILDLNLNLLHLPFPLALSFVTFHTIAFLVNCYDEQIKKINLKDYFLFSIFFPPLIAGPIIMYNHIVNQFNTTKINIFNSNFFNIGLMIFFIGLIKKFFFADILGEYVDSNLSNLDNLNNLNAWMTSLAFTFQFYFDFTAYVDMATGSALLFNIVLPQNFNSPFKASSLIDFWQRWHMTLTNFLTNYVYTPWILSLKNINFFKSMIILFIVFFLAGLWHGPSWNYVLFGSLQGLGLILNHINRNYLKLNLSKFISIFITFNFFNLSFIFFKTKNISDGLYLIKKMFYIDIENNLNSFVNNLNLTFIIIFVLSIIICFYFDNTYRLIKNTLSKTDKNQ